MGAIATQIIWNSALFKLHVQVNTKETYTEINFIQDSYIYVYRATPISTTGGGY